MVSVDENVTVIRRNDIVVIIIQCSDPCSVSAEQLEASMRYTLQARLSPSWNIMGRYLVRGPNLSV